MAQKIYTVQAPDGKLIDIEGPEGASEEEVFRQAKALYQPQAKTPAPTLLESRQQTSKGELERNQPESTLQSRTREYAIGLLEPFDLHNVPGLVENVGGALWDALSGKG